MAVTAIPSRKIKYTRPPLYAKQADAIFAPKRWSIVEASTKSGKTVGCLVWLLEQALAGKAGQNFWWIATVFSTADIAFRRMYGGLPHGMVEKNESRRTISLPNGTTIWFKSAEIPDNLYGEDVYACVVDEASRMREAAWHAIRSTLTATRGPCRIIGNVKGRKNWFYRLARKAETGEQDWHYAKITAHDAVQAGVLAKDEIEGAQRELPEEVFRELYLAEASDDQGNPFGLSHIRACISSATEGCAPVVFGWDLARAIDWTVGIGLDNGGQVCRFSRWQSPWEATHRRILDETGETPALVDCTGVGDAPFERLQSVSQNFQGYLFSQTSKQRLMEALAVAIQHREVRFPEGPIVSELESFEYEYTRTGARYCLHPDTRVLSSDLRWKTAGEYRAGDKILAFDEYPKSGNKTRQWAVANVSSAEVVNRPSFKITLDDNTVIVASQEHQWLVATPDGAEWRRTEQLRAPHPTSHSLRFTPSRIIRLTDVWFEENSTATGYLSAAFDGEGHLSQQARLDRENGTTFRIGFAQKPNAMSEQVREYLRLFGFRWSEGRSNDSVQNFSLLGRQPEILRFLGQIRPRRLLAGFDPNKLGGFWAKSTPSVAEMEFLGDQELIAMGTSTKTLIAEGIASHNSAPEGMHDDCVCALALAVTCRNSIAAQELTFLMPGVKTLDERSAEGQEQIRQSIAQNGFWWPRG